MIKLWSVLSLLSLVGGRSPVRGRRLKEGAIANECLLYQVGRADIGDGVSGLVQGLLWRL